VEIAKYTKAKVIATDISKLALEVANINARMHSVNIELKECDLLCGIKGDILVANPPYVESSYKKPNIYEPDEAFFGGESGVEIIKRLINDAIKLGYKIAIIEIGYNQKDLLASFLEDKVYSFNFFNDLAGRVRGVEIRFI
jgi:release factor glutamine methyltransferase